MSPRFVPENILAKAIAEAESLRAEMRALVWQECKQLAGNLLNTMLVSAENTASFLTHSSPQLRRAAIRLTGFFWQPHQLFADRCEHLAFTDADGAVRLAALDSWFAYYANTADERVGKLLARAVHDASNDLSFRQQAYYGLFVVRGVPPESRPGLIPDPAFLTTVNWSFVDSFF